MARKEFRPWFDLSRNPPIPELRDKRLDGRRPNWWEIVIAKFLMRRWRLRKPTWKSGSVIVPVLWKGQEHSLMQVPELRGLAFFDWRPCTRTLEEWEQINNHLFQHGSVSPSWESEANALNDMCLDSMKATAFAVTEILRHRRSEYARGAPPAGWQTPTCHH